MQPRVSSRGSSRSAEEWIRDGVLERSFTSQLSALSEDAYNDGLRPLREAAQREPGLRFVTDLALHATEARRGDT